jgi:hypothetical protein
MKSQHSIISINKLVDNLKITQAMEHNLRTRHQKNIDRGRTRDNECLYDNLGTSGTPSDFQIKLNAKYQQIGVKEKKNSVLALEFVLAASPEFWFSDVKGWNLEEWNKLRMTREEDRKKIRSFWKKLDPKKLEAWKKLQIEFAKEQYGDALERVDLHLDEKTPHCHVIINTAIKSIKNYKNKDPKTGEYRHYPKESWSLNSARFNPEYLREMHDKYALKMKPFGLKRGERRSENRKKIEGMEVKHQSLKDYYKEGEDQRYSALEKEMKLIEREKKIKELIPKIKDELKRQSDTILNLLDILGKKDLTEEESEYLDQIIDKNKNISKKI